MAITAAFRSSTPRAVPPPGQRPGRRPVAQQAQPSSETARVLDATSIRFDKPAAPSFGVAGSLGSIVSLAVMSAISSLMLLRVLSPQEKMLDFLVPPLASGEAMPAWVWLPFLFTVIGSTLGLLFEVALLITGRPFQQTRTPLTTFVRNLRLLNLAPVTATILFFVGCMVLPEENLRMALLCLAGALGAGLSVGLFFGSTEPGGAEPLVPALLLVTQIAQACLAIFYGAGHVNTEVIGLLVAQAALQAASFVISAQTPWRSTAFHLLSTASGFLLYLALVRVIAVNPQFATSVRLDLAAGSLLTIGLVLAMVIGLVTMLRVSRRTYNNLRSMVSSAIWGAQYFVLVSQARFPKPKSLREIYAVKGTLVTELRPYYQVHPDFLPQALSIPAAAKLEDSVSAIGDLVKKVRKTFAVISQMDHVLPQADSGEALRNKPRLPLYSDGSDFYPRIFLKKLFGATIPGPELEKTPLPALENYRDGQYLAYLAESGVASPLLQPATARGEGWLVLDLRFLERYATKADYQPYGGAAYFYIDKAEQQLVLHSVIAPRTDEEILAVPQDATFRWAESRILASLYFQVIAGKHLAGIHMTYNLVEVAMHNAFDAQGQFEHPFRAFMYLHFFSHELAEELTTEHLLQEGAVFSQVFATTHDSLIAFLNDSYHRFEYADDEDFERRVRLLSLGSDLLPNSAIRWELQYAEIWSAYAQKMVDILYADNAAVVADSFMQEFYRQLCSVLPNGLPARHEELRTKEGLTRFIADTIHHLVVRHQVYGTTGVKAAMDPRINTTQVPCDTGTPGVDEWRSLVCVALATARARFTLLMDDYKYLLDGVDARYSAPMRTCFDELQTALRNLDTQWNVTDDEKNFSYNYFRAVPSELHTGPGY